MEVNYREWVSLERKEVKRDSASLGSLNSFAVQKTCAQNEK
jgi:hypothetical protein